MQSCFYFHRTTCLWCFELLGDDQAHDAEAWHGIALMVWCNPKSVIILSSALFYNSVIFKKCDSFLFLIFSSDQTLTFILGTFLNVFSPVRAYSLWTYVVKVWFAWLCHFCIFCTLHRHHVYAAYWSVLFLPYWTSETLKVNSENIMMIFSALHQFSL